MERIPNRIGIFVTFLSLVLFVAGALLVIGAPYGESVQKALGTIFLVIGLLGFLLGYITVRMYFWALKPKYVTDDTPNNFERYDSRSTHEPEGIGGWLILPMLGLLLAPFQSIKTIVEMFEIKDFTKLPHSIQYLLWTNGWGLTLLLGILPIVLLILMFRHSSLFPRAYIIWLVTTCCLAVAASVATFELFKPYLDAAAQEKMFIESVATSITLGISLAVWVPYMIFSRRVRNTFAQKSNAGDDHYYEHRT